MGTAGDAVGELSVFCDALGGVAVNADAVARAFASATF